MPSVLRRLIAGLVAVMLILNTPGMLLTVAADDAVPTAETEIAAAETTATASESTESAGAGTSAEEQPTEPPEPSPTPTEEPTEAPPPPTSIPEPTLDPTEVPTQEPATERPIETPTVAPTVEPAPTRAPKSAKQVRAAEAAEAQMEIQAGSATLPLTLALNPSATVTVGAAVTGQAGWSSAPSGTPTGTVQYLVFSGANCTGAQFADAGTRTIDPLAGANGSVAASASVDFPASGAYSWRAVYSGDDTYAANQVCTNLTVNPATPTLALTLSPTSPTTAGIPITGTATLTNASANAGGTTTYTVYTNNSCTTQVTPNQTSTKTVTDRIVPASDPVIFDTIGTYYWRAVYSGDANNQGASSSCVTLVVNKSTPTVTLPLTPNPVTIGGTVTGTAMLANISRIAGGTVTYTVYTSSSCSTQVNPAQTSTETVSQAVAGTSDPFTFNTVGTLYWRAVYSGDANSNGASSPCTALTVAKTAPTLTLEVEPPSAAADSSFVAKATLTGTTATAGGTVTYTLYSNNTCSTTLSATGSPSTKTVVNGVVPDSTAVTLTVAATRYWKATYAGDASNGTASSACVAFNVVKASPTIDLTVTPAVSPMKAGGTARGAATLNGATAAAAGSVVYTVYADSSCTTVQTLTSNPSTVTVASRVVPLSATITFNAIGTYYWQAVYAGDANNNGATSPCVPLTVAKSDPALALTITPTLSPMKAGGSATGRGTLTLAGATAGGTITYRVYTESTCTTLLTASANPSVKTVTNRSPASSSRITITQAGTVYWQAIYGGDANNNGATSPCVAQSVAKSDPTLSMVPTASSSPMKAAGTAYGKSTLGSATSNAGGAVTFTVYTESTCTTVLSAANTPSTVTVTNKSVPSSPTVTIPYAGTVYWRSVYTGDINNNGATSACTAQTVAKATPTLTLSVVAVVSPMVSGGSAIGKVTMTKSTTAAAGALTYTVYSDSTCATQLTATGNPNSVTVANKTVPNSAPITITTVGTVYWKASYAGDTDNAAAVSSCVSLAVAKASPTASLTVTSSTSPMTAGSTATGMMTLTNATGSAGGTVVYTVYTNNTCTTQVSPAQTATKTVTNGVAQSSGAFTFNTIGTYYWKAVYSGDTTNNTASSACVALSVVGAASASLSLSLAPNPVEIETPTFGVAALAGTTSTAGGTVTYTVYSNNTCTTAFTVTGSPSVKTVTNGVVPNSTGIAFAATTTRYWRAVYSGDANNSTATSPCVALTVVKKSPTLAMTFAVESVDAGIGQSGTAILSGATSTVSGTVTYTVYSNNLCSSQVTPNQSSTVTIAGGLVPSSAALTVNVAGTAYWRAAYAGDTTNNAATSPCTPLTVDKASSAVNLTITPAQILVWESASAAATLSHVTATAGGTVAYAVYLDTSCSTELTPTRRTSRTVTAGAVAASAISTFDEADTFYWQAVYSGDANNEPVTSACTGLPVNGGSLTASVTSVTLNPVGYSTEARSNTGTLTLSVTDQRGTSDGWSVSLSVSSFTYTGPSPVATPIPASAFRITAAGAPSRVSGQAIDAVEGPLVPTDAIGPLDQPVEVLVADAGYGAGVYTQTLAVELAIPARTQAGSYTAVLQTVTSAAP